MKTASATVIILLILLLVNIPHVFSSPVGEYGAGDTNSTPNTMSLMTCSFKGHYYGYFTTYSNMMRMPGWKTGTSEPPLSARSALHIAEKSVRSLCSADATLEPLKIVLMNWFGGVWYYDVQFQVFDDSPYPGYRAPFDIIVLMDGKVADREEVVADPLTHAFIPVHK